MKINKWFFRHFAEWAFLGAVFALSLWSGTEVLAEGESLSDFDYQIPIIITNNTGAALSDTPVAIRVFPDNLVTPGFVQADGEDIRASNSVQIELEVIGQGLTGPATDTFWWLDVDNLADGSSGTWFLHIGNTTATGDQEFRFDGTTDTVTATDHPDLDITTNLTVETEANLNSIPSAETELVEKDEAYAIGVESTNQVFGRIWTDTTENLRPNGDVSPNAATPSGCAGGSHFDCVDEVSQDGDSTYLFSECGVGCSSISVRERFNLGDSATISTDIIDSVDVHWVSRHTNASDGSGFIQPRLHLAGEETAGSNTATTATYAEYNQTLARPGGGTWTSTDLDSLEVDLTINAATSPSSSTSETRLTQVFIVVNYHTPNTVTFTPIVVDTDYDFRMTYDGNDLQLFIDEILQATTAVTGSINTNSNNLIAGSGIDGHLDNIIVGNYQNELLNPSFEETSPDLQDWTDFATATGTDTRDTSVTLFGSASLQLNMTDCSSPGQVVELNQDVTASVGQVWSIGAWGRLSAANDGRGRIHLQFLDAGLATLQNTETDLTTVSTTFSELTIQNITAPASTAFLRLRLRTVCDATDGTATTYWDGARAFQATTVPSWPATSGVLEWESEPDELAQTQEGNAGNSWTWLGTVEDISTGGVDHDGTYSITRDMTDITRFSQGLEINNLPVDAVISETVADVLGSTGDVGSSTEPDANFLGRGVFDALVNDPNWPSTPLAFWFMMTMIAGGVFAYLIYTRLMPNEMLAVMPIVGLSFLAWKVGVFPWWLPLAISLVSLAAIGGIRKFASE